MEDKKHSKSYREQYRSKKATLRVSLTIEEKEGILKVLKERNTTIQAFFENLINRELEGVDCPALGKIREDLWEKTLNS